MLLYVIELLLSYMKKIKVILGSSREGRNGKKVADWFMSQTEKYKEEMEFELLDLADWPIPFFNSPVSPAMGGEPTGLTKDWAEKIAEADGVIIVTPEYNHGYPAVLKNALDVIYKEWNYKPVSFVSYGAVSGGIRAVEQLKQVVLELKMYPMHEEVNIHYVWQAFDEDGRPVDESLNSKAKALLETLKSFLNK